MVVEEFYKVQREYLSVLIQRYIFLRGVRVVRSRLSCAFIAIRIPMLGS